jgi:hypothetical protein
VRRGWAAAKCGRWREPGWRGLPAAAPRRGPSGGPRGAVAQGAGGSLGDTLQAAPTRAPRRGTGAAVKNSVKLHGLGRSHADRRGQAPPGVTGRRCRCRRHPHAPPPGLPPPRPPPPRPHPLRPPLWPPLPLRRLAAAARHGWCSHRRRRRRCRACRAAAHRRARAPRRPPPPCPLPWPPPAAPTRRRAPPPLPPSSPLRAPRARRGAPPRRQPRPAGCGPDRKKPGRSPGGLPRSGQAAGQTYGGPTQARCPPAAWPSAPPSLAAAA